ncbi:MAG: hypothetical protein QMC67_02805 [Candidatus Wallbacteria bacterium]
MDNPPKKRSAFSKPSNENIPGNTNSGFSGGGDSLDSLEPSKDSSSFSTSGNDENVYVPESRGEYNLPESIKIDLTTSLEQFILAGLIISGIISAVLFFNGTFGHTSGRGSYRHYYPPDPEMLHYLPLAIAAVIFFALAYWMTDNYYILRTEQKKIYYHFKFLFYESVTLFLTCDNILAVGVTGEERHSKHDHWWVYKICIITRKGEMIDFSDWEREACGALNAQAKGMARVFQCQFAECPGFATLRVEPAGGSFNIYFGTKGFLDGISWQTLPVLIAIAIGVLTVIYSLVLFG